MAIITVSRGSLGLGAALAEKVAGVLGYPCMGREVALGAAEKLGIEPELMRKKVEESPSLWQRMTAERAVYVVAMQALLAERAAEGRLVYHGYSGHLLLRGMPALLRVRVIAPMEVRVPRIMKEQGLKEAGAQAYIRKVDEARARWTKFVFGVDWQDPSLYDLVLNLGAISVDSACEALAALALRPEFAVDGPALDRLRDYALASRIRLALATSPLTRTWNLEVEVKDRIATIRGTIPRDPRYADSETRFKKTLTDMVLAIEGVNHVTLGVDTQLAAPVD